VEVEVTFPEDGMNGHPDHVAIHHAVKEAVMSGRCPSVVKMYYNLSKALEEKGISPTLRIDTEPHWAMKAKALRAHESQILSIERVFGDLTACPADRRYEKLVLSWERGKDWPLTQEAWITDRC
jgi:LmbE family N-acetylglucosaminyl deacetylase